MNKVTLSAKEFLSAYTGVLLGESMDVVYDAFEKLYGYTDSVLNCDYQRDFSKLINTTRPDLVDAINKIGEFKKVKGVDIMKQVDDYIKKFTDIIGSDTIEIELQNQSSSFDELCR